MWKPYLKVIAKRASAAIHVLDRFQIMTHFSKAIDEVRADEARNKGHLLVKPCGLAQDGCLWLKHAVATKVGSTSQVTALKEAITKGKVKTSYK